MRRRMPGSLMARVLFYCPKIMDEWTEKKEKTFGDPEDGNGFRGLFWGDVQAEEWTRTITRSTGRKDERTNERPNERTIWHFVLYKILSLYIHWRPYNMRSYFVFSVLSCETKKINERSNKWSEGDGNKEKGKLKCTEVDHLLQTNAWISLCQSTVREPFS